MYGKSKCYVKDHTIKTETVSPKSFLHGVKMIMSRPPKKVLAFVIACVFAGCVSLLPADESALCFPVKMDKGILCEPCEKVNGCGRGTGLQFDFGGWVETGVMTNSHGWMTNGPMHTKGNERTDFSLDQLYLHGDLKYKGRSGIEWGGRADLVYGVDAPGMQSYGDDTFDSGWGNNRHDYGLAMYQLYGTASYRNLSVKVGKFITPIGWEGSASKDNFFYSHSYCYWLEPSTHFGAVADYTVNDRLVLSAGWTAGNDSGFENRYGDDALLAGLTFHLTKKATIYYWMTVGKTENGFHSGQWRLDDFGDLARQDFFIQSLCLEWMPTDRFTYVMQYNVRNDADVQAGTFRTARRYSAYGINNHFLYTLNDRWATGLRLEWARDNGGFGYITEETGNYFQMTLGLNWTPCEHLAFRPEIRYDSVLDGNSRPFGDGRRDQVTGGCALLFFF